MMLPNVIIPGAPKAGTTSIAAMLNQHPDIFLPPIKEPRFFIHDKITELTDADPLKKYLLKTSILDWTKYKTIYSTKAKLRIDASIQYLFYYKTTVYKIKEYLGDPHIILILRNPIYRAFSNYVFNIKSEKCNTLMDAIKDELNGGRNDLNSFYHYYKQGLYYEQVKLFKDNFSNVTVLFYEDFQKNNLAFVNSICNVLGIPAMENIPELPKLNTSAKLTLFGQFILGKYSPIGIIYNHILPIFFSRGVLFNNRLKIAAKFSKKEEQAKIVLTNNEKEYLKDIYKNDVKQLMQLLNINSCPWNEFDL